MAQAIITFFEGITKSKALIAALLAVLPVTEIKGSVLFAAATEGELWLSVLAGYLSSVLLAALLSFTVPRMLAFAKRSRGVGRAVSFLTDRLNEKAERILESAKSKGEKGREDRFFFGVFLFVAIPLPMTGVWTGALLAAILRLGFKRTFFSLSAGNFTAAGVTLAVALLAGDHADLVFDLFLLFALAALTFTIVKSLVEKRKKKRVL